MNIRDTFLPFALPQLDESEDKEVLHSMSTGWITTGPKTKLFEEALAEYLGVKHVIAVHSCTAALHLALAAVGVGEGDEVLVPTLTFAATANVVVHLGGTPVLVDIDRETFNIDFDDAEKKVTAKTKAIVPVHYAGQPVDMKRLAEFAAKHRLRVVEDAAHAIGSSFDGKMIGTFSDATCFSFYPTKNMTTIEGGAVATNDDEIAEKVRVLSLHGITKDAWKRYTASGSWYYEIMYPGFKYNMTDIQASVGIHQLKKLDRFIDEREVISRAFDEAFADLPAVRLPQYISGTRIAKHLYPILVLPESSPVTRDEFIDAMKERQVGTSVHFIPLHHHPYYQQAFGYKQEDLPNASWVFERIVSLPMYPKMTKDDVAYVIEATKDVLAA